MGSRHLYMFGPRLQKNLSCLLGLFLRLLLFLLPWQTIWIIVAPEIGGSKWEYGTIGFYATEGLLWSAVVASIFLMGISYARRERKQWRFTPDRRFAAIVLLVVLYGFLSSVWAPDTNLALQHARRILEAFLFFFLLLTGPLSPKTVVLWFIGGSILPSLLGIFQFFSQSTFSSSLLGLSAHPAWQAGTSVVSSLEIGRWLRAYGTFAHPNVFGGYLVAVLFSVCAFFFLKEREEEKKSASGNRMLVFVSAPLIASALFFTFSRSAWLGAGAVMAAFFFRRHCSFVLMSIIVLCASISFLYAPLLTTRIQTSSAEEIRSLSERQHEYDEAWKLFLTHPFFGVGVGNYTAALYFSDPTRSGFAYQPVHNTIILGVVEYGVIGSLLFGLVFLFWWKWGKRVSFGVIIGISVLFLFDHYWYSSFSGLMFSALVCYALTIRSAIAETQ